MSIYDNIINFIMIPLVTLIGIYFSHKLKFIHITNLYKSLSFLKNSHTDNNDKNISSFVALSTILGGNLGTGNISGVAVALTTGGPGSLFWMVIIIFLISVIKYVGCFLGIKYRIKDKKGQYIGGPMYYIDKGTSSPKIAALFAISLIFSALTVGNLVQVNSMVLPIVDYGISPIFYGLSIAMIILLVTLGGMVWFSEIITKIVPLMAIIYLSACSYILVNYYEAIIPAFTLIINSAFDLHNISGSILGYSVIHLFSTIKVGFTRGIFATDIGLGLEAIVHANVQNGNNEDEFAFQQSIISVLSPFIVMLLCIITGLVLIVTGVWNTIGLESTKMCFTAFNIGIPSGLAGYLMLLVLFCFAFTTILTWMFCGNKAIEYLFPNNKAAMLVWKIFFITLLPIGSIASVSFSWKIADVAISIMLMSNIYAMLILFKNVTAKHKNHNIDYNDFSRENFNS
ncbi:MAG: sodium:alanine symporter family protein [Rickettsiaceae bacterium H1]|nr:sodium:alanine symporter family protein [Rickettsiaceae bacterium H1]